MTITNVTRVLVLATGVAAALALAGFLVAASGIVSIKASSGHWPVTAWILNFSMQRSVSTHTLGMKLPPLGEPWMVLKGAGHYDIACLPCHGGPDRKPPRIPAAMTPHPPELSPLVSDRAPEELFYVVKHGIKFTGMPAWPSQRRDDEVRAVVAFLLRMPHLTAESYRRLVDGDRPPDGEGSRVRGLPDSLDVPRVVTASCAPCHGTDGHGRDLPAFPRIAGQKREYLLRAMNSYADGTRHSGIMEPVAAALDPRAREELATYYSRLPAAERPLRAGEVSAERSSRIARGESIARGSLASSLVPSCVHCHGPSAHERNTAYPELAGQFAEYLELQLELFQTGARGGSAYGHLMDHVAPHLDESAIRDVAAYYESLPGGRP